MKKVKVIPNVKNYSVCGDSLIVNRTNGEKLLNNKNIKEYFESALEVSFIQSELNLLLFRLSDRRLITDFNLNVLSEYESNFVFFKEHVSSRKELKMLSSEFESGLDNKIFFNFHLVNIDNGKKELDLGKRYLGFKYLIGNEMICSFFKEEQIISVFKISSEAPVWSFSLESLGKYTNQSNQEKPYEVEHFIGVWNSYLLIQLSGASLLALDIENGKLIKLLKFKEYVDLPQGAYLSDYTKMHLAYDKLIWLNRQSLFHITLNDFSVENRQNYFNVPREEQFTFYKNTLDGGKIYFCADYGWQYATPSRIGVMDADTGEVLWQEQLEKTGGLPDAPQVAGDKLYIRTVNKELYIFERE